MGILREKFIKSFWAYDKADNSYKINVFRSIINIGDFQDSNGTRLGRMRLTTNEGLTVNLVDIDKGEYLIIQTNTLIYSNEVINN